MRDRDAEHCQPHAGVIDPSVLSERSQRAGSDSHEQCNQISSQSEGGRDWQRAPENLIYGLAFILERGAEIELRDVPKHTSILNVPRFVQPVLLTNIFFYRRGKFFIARIEITGSEPDQCPGQRHHDKEHRDNDDNATDYEAEHADSNQSSSERRNPTLPDRVRCRSTSRQKEWLDSDTFL